MYKPEANALQKIFVLGILPGILPGLGPSMKMEQPLPNPFAQ